MLTTRAAKWVAKQIAGGQTVRHLARELDCGWDAINTAVRIYGTAWLAADTKRLKETTAIGLDESLFVRAGPLQAQDVVDHGVRRGQPCAHRRAPDQGLHRRWPAGCAPSPTT